MNVEKPPARIVKATMVALKLGVVSATDQGLELENGGRGHWAEKDEMEKRRLGKEETSNKLCNYLLQGWPTQATQAYIENRDHHNDGITIIGCIGCV
jgi:hypothetical protein